MGNKKVRISVLETTKPENALSMAKELIQGMEEIKQEEKLDAMFFFAVDILKTAADLLVPGQFEEELSKKAFEKEFSDEIMHLEGVVSRKNQMIPNIERAIK